MSTTDLSARLRHLFPDGSGPSLAEALATIYQPLYPDVLLTTAPVTAPPHPLVAFLNGGCDLRTATADIVFSKEEYACTRTACDPLQAAIEAAIPAGSSRENVLDATEDRLRACWQRAFLANHTAADAAGARQTLRNVQCLLRAPASCGTGLEASLLGILEAAGAVTAKWFTAAEVRSVAAVLAQECQHAETVELLKVGLAGRLRPAAIEKLRRIGFNVEWLTTSRGV